VLPPLSEPGEGFGWLEVPQVEIVDGRAVLIFNCLAEAFGGGRTAAGGPGGVWAAPAYSLLGPYDITRATRLTDERRYVGKLVRDPADRWVFLAFDNDGDDGRFVGTLSDPAPVGWTGTGLAVAFDPDATVSPTTGAQRVPPIGPAV
jgi:beta-fructofuranosidase